MEVDKSKCLNTYAWYFKRKKARTVYESICVVWVYFSLTVAFMVLNCM